MPAKKSSTLQTQPANLPTPEESAREGEDLLAAAFAIFDQGGTRFTTKSGKEVNIFPAKVKQLTKIMQFFHQVSGALENSDLVKLVDSISEKQREHMAAGLNPRALNIKELIAADGAGIALNNASIISLLLQSIFEYLPGLVSVFTDVNEEEFGEFDLDEAAMVTFGIFSVNYDFFIQRVLPLLVAFIQSLVRENQKTSRVAKSLKTNTN